MAAFDPAGKANAPPKIALGRVAKDWYKPGRK
jgi:hypothetical protein